MCVTEPRLEQHQIQDTARSGGAYQQPLSSTYAEIHLQAGTNAVSALGEDKVKMQNQF
jgi:hypothetical protein